MKVWQVIGALVIMSGCAMEHRVPGGEDDDVDTNCTSSSEPCEETDREESHRCPTGSTCYPEEQPEPEPDTCAPVREQFHSLELLMGELPLETECVVDQIDETGMIVLGPLDEQLFVPSNGMDLGTRFEVGEIIYASRGESTGVGGVYTLTGEVSQVVYVTFPSWEGFELFDGTRISGAGIGCSAIERGTYGRYDNRWSGIGATAPDGSSAAGAPAELITLGEWEMVGRSLSSNPLDGAAAAVPTANAIVVGPIAD